MASRILPKLGALFHQGDMPLTECLVERMSAAQVPLGCHLLQFTSLGIPSEVLPVCSWLPAKGQSANYLNNRLSAPKLTFLMAFLSNLLFVNKRRVF